MKPFSGLVTILIALALAVAGNVLVLSAPAQAATGKMRACRISDWENGSKTYRQITLKRTAFEMTHAERRRIPRGVGFSRAVTMTTQSVVKSSIEASASIQADAGAFFAKASVEAGLKVAGERSSTDTESITETFTVPKAKRDRLFVFYTGVDTFKFKVHKRVCSRQQENYYGTLRSFNSITESGAVLCPHTRYKKGTIRYQVTRKAGC